MRRDIKSTEQVNKMIEMLISAFRVQPSNFITHLDNNGHKVKEIYFSPHGNIKETDDAIENFTFKMEINNCSISIEHTSDTKARYNNTQRFWCDRPWLLSFSSINRNLRTLTDMIIRTNKNKYLEWQKQQADKVIEHLAGGAVEEILLEDK